MDRLTDRDLLVSVILKRNTISFNPEKKNKPKGCSSVGVGSLGKKIWSRTVLSWLIQSGAISLYELIQIRSPVDGAVLKEGIVTRCGLVCLCCNKELSMSEFWRHADIKSKWPSVNLFLESGQPIILCQLEAWSAEYQARKASVKTSEVYGTDYLCGICGNGGNLRCCDGCSATFHEQCLFETLPEGNWYCHQCRCRTCSGLVTDKDPSLCPGMVCSLCKHRYHETCIKGGGVNSGKTLYNWFCGVSCQEIYYGLQSRIGLTNTLAGDLYWRLLRCIDGDLKAHSSLDFVAYKAECNSKLAAAITVMEDSFEGMVDQKTKINLIPQTIYNWGCQLPRLNFEDFFTVVLEKDDVVVSVASIRIHGIQVAEIPFIATCNKFRNQGMCRILVTCIEEMLKSLKIETLVLCPCNRRTLDLWTKKFRFKRLNEEVRASLRNVNLMLLPGCEWVVKTL